MVNKIKSTNICTDVQVNKIMFTNMGTCHIHLKPYRIESVTVNSPYDLLTGTGSVYGEYSDFYDARDAEGSSKLHAYEQLIYRQCGKDVS